MSIEYTMSSSMPPQVNHVMWLQLQYKLSKIPSELPTTPEELLAAFDRIKDIKTAVNELIDVFDIDSEANRRTLNAYRTNAIIRKANEQITKRYYLKPPIIPSQLSNKRKFHGSA